MTKIRKFFAIGRKPKKRVQKEHIELPENFIVGSTNQKVSEDRKNASEEDQLKSDGRTDGQNKKVLR